MSKGGVKMTKGKYTKGFTLVELLVVIAIIAILAGAMFVVINPAKLMSKARDSRRISEVQGVNKAIAAAFADGKITAPAALVSRNSQTTLSVLPDGTGWAGGWTVPANSTSIRDYMAVLPRDPVGATNTCPKCYYFGMSVAGDWEIDAVLENFDNAQLSINDGGNQGSTATCTAALMPIATCRYEVGTNVPGNVI